MGAPPMSAASLQSGFQPGGLPSRVAAPQGRDSTQLLQGPMNSMPNMNSMPAMGGLPHVHAGAPST